MGMHFASMPITNATHICIGTITAKEAEALRSEGHNTDGLGYYLFLADETSPESPIEILAPFLDASKAEALAKLFAGRN